MWVLIHDTHTHTLAVLNRWEFLRRCEKSRNNNAYSIHNFLIIVTNDKERMNFTSKTVAFYEPDVNECKVRLCTERKQHTKIEWVLPQFVQNHCGKISYLFSFFSLFLLQTNVCPLDSMRHHYLFYSFFLTQWFLLL